MGKNNPSEPVQAYTFNNGDSGRITNVGQALAGTKLDLIYTVVNSDQDKWMSNSGFAQDGRVKGLAFTGEQYIEGSENNSIVALYNGANCIDIKYKIVRHNTFTEQPILVSFITTDIDVGQGVATNLANLAIVMPKETNLTVDNGIIYDSSHTGPYHYGADLNGANDLPYGGYLGVSFLSNFDYTFFAPAPANNDIYQFATGVRYDLFGSALQTKLVINRQTHLSVKYVDDEGKELQATTKVVGTNDFPNIPKAPVIKGYELSDTKTNIVSPDEEEIIYQYLPEYQLTVEYVDEQGNSLSAQQKLTAIKGALIQLQPVEVEGYQLPPLQSVIVNQDNKIIKLVYSKQQLQTRIEYTDEYGHALSRPQIISSSYGSKILIRPIQIPGYNAPNARSLKVVDNSTVRLIYTRSFLARSNYIPFRGYRNRPAITISHSPYRSAYRPVAWARQPQQVQQTERKGYYSGPKLHVVNFKIYKPTKHVNKQVQKKKQADWFQKNTGMSKKNQKKFFSVLNAIDKDGKKRGLSQKERNLEQLYYIAGVNYSTSKPQQATSRVGKYNPKRLSKIVGKSKANRFKTILQQQSTGHKVDLPHMAVTAASSLDNNVGVKNSQSIFAGSDTDRSFLSSLFTGKSLTNTHGLAPDVDQWLFTNGYYGDKIVDGNISKEDLNADLDVYSLVSGKGSAATQLRKMYGSNPKGLTK